MATIGEQIRTARKAKGMTQDDLASALNVTRSGISKWETNDRVPDAEMLLRLSETLNYQFALSSEENAPEEAEESETSVKKDEKQDAAALSDTASPDGQLASNSSKSNTVSSRIARFLPFVAVALALIILVGFLVNANQPKPKDLFYDGNGNGATMEEFRTAVPNDPSKAYLSFQNSLKFTGEGLKKHVYFTFDMREDNGIALRIDRIDLFFFYSNEKYTVDTVTAQMLIDTEKNPEIPAYGTFSFAGGTDCYTDNGDPNAYGAGIKVYCTDAGDNQLVFQSIVDFPLE